MKLKKEKKGVDIRKHNFTFLSDALTEIQVQSIELNCEVGELLESVLNMFYHLPKDKREMIVNHYVPQIRARRNNV